MSKTEISENVQSTYDEQYTDDMTQWRQLGARFKAENILEMLAGKSYQKVLDFGAGEGSILQFLDKNEQFQSLYALEISDSGIAQIKRRHLQNLKEVKKFDGYTTNYADNEFDLIYCSHVIEHVEHPRLVLREIKRISKYQVFEVPLDYNKQVDTKMKHFLDYGHINIYTPSLFKFLLKSEGFKIEKEKHCSIEKEVLSFNWYKTLKHKKTLKRRIFFYLAINKARIAKMLFGQARSNEFYHNAYTCLTSHSGDLKIF